MLLDIIKILLNTVSLILLFWLGFNALYMLFYAVCGLFYNPKQQQQTTNIKKTLFPRIAVIIPAYKEDAVIIKTAESITNQNYPFGKFQILVVADGLKKSTISKLNKLDLKTLEVNFENSTKAKAINTGLNYLPETFDLTVILDADNIIKPDFLNLIAEAFLNGHNLLLM